MKIETIGVVGAGTMGAGIAQVAAAAGQAVYLFDVQDGAAAKGIERTAKGLKKLVSRGKMTSQDKDALLSRIQTKAALQDLKDTDLVIEAIVEDTKIKQQVFQALAEVGKPSQIFATNTSSISVTEIAAQIPNPERVVGMHFFNPAPIMKLVEVISGQQTDCEVAAMVFELAKSWNKTPVYAKPTPGFIVNRVARPYYGEALRLLEEQVSDAVTIDALLTDSAGFRMGPFTLMDLIGIDVNFSVSQSVYRAMFDDPKFRPSLIQQEMVAAGHLGRKTGKGFYDYTDDEKSVEVTRITSDHQPRRVVLVGGWPTMNRALNDAGIPFDREEGDGFLEIEGVRLYPCDGRSATQIARQCAHADTVVVDYAKRYFDCATIAVSTAEQSKRPIADIAAGLFNQMKSGVVLVDDQPGMVVGRILSCLINEAADAVAKGICSAEGVDQAMQKGVNYPNGLLRWCDEIGTANVLEVMENLQQWFGEDRYRPSTALRRQILRNLPFHDHA